MFNVESLVYDQSVTVILGAPPAHSRLRIPRLFSYSDFLNTNGFQSIKFFGLIISSSNFFMSAMLALDKLISNSTVTSTFISRSLKQILGCSIMGHKFRVYIDSTVLIYSGLIYATDSFVNNRLFNRENTHYPETKTIVTDACVKLTAYGCTYILGVIGPGTSTHRT